MSEWTIRCEACGQPIVDDEPFFTAGDCHVHDRCGTPEREKPEPLLRVVEPADARAAARTVLEELERMEKGNG